MAYKHGVYGYEVPTSIVPPVQVSAGLPVVFGTAPIHLASSPAKANKPMLCYTYAEAVEQFGYSDDWDKYTLCEFMKSHFALFNVAPVVLINVLDTNVHKINIIDKAITLVNKIGKITEPVIVSTLIVKLTSAGQPLVRNTDYTVAYSDEGDLIITALTGGAITGDNIVVSFDKVNPSSVTKDDIIGGVDINTGDYEGLELINQIFPYFRLVPGLILAPKWSCNSEVAAVMVAKASNINGHFKCIALTDIPTETITKYADAPNWKNQNNYMSARQVVCWPKINLGDKQYHLSTQLAGVICKTDADNEDVPYVSPSNKSLQIDSAVLANGKDIMLGTDIAAYLNGQGIITAINFIGGWKVWGNRTGVYPSVTDPKDAFIPIRRMFDWINNTLITTYWQKVDFPINKRLVETIVDSANLWLNALTARQFILGGRVEFRADENPNINLMDGIIKFHVYITPPSPAREIDFILEYDPKYLETLFA